MMMIIIIIISLLVIILLSLKKREHCHEISFVDNTARRLQIWLCVCFEGVLVWTHAYGCVLLSLKLYIYGARTLRVPPMHSFETMLCYNWQLLRSTSQKCVKQYLPALLHYLMVSAEIECLLHYNLLESSQTQLPFSRATVQVEHTLCNRKSFCPLFHYWKCFQGG